MSLDLFEKQTEDRLSSMTPIDSVEAGAFDGFARGTLNTTMKGCAEAASGISPLGAVGPTVQDCFTGGTEARDRFFKRHDEVFGRAVEYWTPEPGEVGVAGQIAGSLLSTIPMVFASPPTAVAATQMSVSQQLAKKGVEPVNAQAAGAAFATGLGLGIWVPILGTALIRRGGGSSLWPCPSPPSAALTATYGGWALPSILLCGARTFLSVPRHAATVWPTPYKL